MLYKDKNIILIIVNTMYKIKDYLYKYNKEYPDISSFDKFNNIKNIILNIMYYKKEQNVILKTY